MKTFKIEGTITQFEVGVKQSKSGKDYDSGWFLLADEDGCVFKFDVWGKLAGRFGSELSMMDVVDVDFLIDVRDWNGRWFTNLKAQEVSLVGGVKGSVKKADVSGASFKESMYTNDVLDGGSFGDLSSLPVSDFEKGSFIDDDGSDLPF